MTDCGAMPSVIGRPLGYGYSSRRAYTLQEPLTNLSCRCCATENKQGTVQCVRIEHNRDSSTTYFFSETGSTTPVWQRLDAQLAAPNTAEPSLPEQQSEKSLQHSNAEAVVTRLKLPEVVLAHNGTAVIEQPRGESLQREGGSQEARVVEIHHISGGTESKPPTSGSSHTAEPNKADPLGLNGRLKITRETSEEAPSTSMLHNGTDIRANLERTWFEDSEETTVGRNAPSRKQMLGSGSNFAHATLAGMDEANEDVLDLLCKYSDLCRASQLDAALTALSRYVKAERHDVLMRLRQKHFLKEAGRQATSRAVRQALRFVQVLPRAYANLRTYNMLVTVCIRARDMASALQAADMLRSTGRKPDAFLYTNLISACAAAGDADAAFRLHSEMMREGLAADKFAATSLVNACSREILNTCASQRRQQLVLLERAGGVLQDVMKCERGNVDHGIWNAFITAAGRASQLQRAVQALNDMQAAGIKPDAATYGAILDACVRNNDKDLALKMYTRALKAGFVGNMHIYTSAIAACRSDKDMATALQIFNELQRHGLQPDERLYGVLISVIGSASLSTALDLQEDLLSSGVVPLQGILSNLIDACLDSKELGTAKRLFQEAQESNVQLSTNTVNAVINAFGKAGQLEEVVDLLITLTSKGFIPDKFMYTALLNACQRADAGDHVFAVWRVMQHRRIPLDEAICFILLRTCFNQIQIARRAGDSIEAKSQKGDKQLETRLVQALTEENALYLAPSPEEKLPWGKRAISVYQKLVAAGVKPGMHVLERVLACLRLQPLAEKPNLSAGYSAPLKMRGYLLPDGRKASAPQHSVDGIFEKRALSILEEAIALGVLPSFQTNKGGIVDLRSMPPTVAEIYVLKILASLAESSDVRNMDMRRLIFQTPPYEARSVNARRLPHCSEASSAVNRTSPAEASTATDEDCASSSANGLAVASLLRRLGMRTVGNPAAGETILTAEVLTRWMRLAQRAASNMEMASLNSVQKASRFRSSILDQQMRIRLGMEEEHEGTPQEPVHNHIPHEMDSKGSVLRNRREKKSREE